MKKTTKILMILSFCFCIISACVAVVFATSGFEMNMNINGISFQPVGWLEFSVSDASFHGLTKLSGSGEMKGFTINNRMDEQDTADYAEINGWNNVKLQFKSSAKGMGQISFTVKNNNKNEGACLYVEISTNMETSSTIKAIPSGDFYLNPGQAHTFTIDIMSINPTSYSTISGLKVNLGIEEVIASEWHCSQEYFESEGIYFTLNDDYTATLTKYTRSGNVAYIPDMVQNNDYDNLKCYTVTQIANGTSTTTGIFYSARTRITSIDFPETLVSIGDYAFYSCSYINSAITMPSSIERVGKYAFYLAGSSSTKPTISLSQRIKQMGTYAFANSKIRGAVSIPGMLKKIPTYAFYSCTSITSLIIPYAITSIEANAFGNCSTISEIVCYPLTPPTCGTNAFLNHDGPDLYVPSPVYNTVSPWNGMAVWPLEDY